MARPHGKQIFKAFLVCISPSQPDISFPTWIGAGLRPLAHLPTSQNASESYSLLFLSIALPPLWLLPPCLALRQLL
jgi:hypothetical protein